MVTKLEEIPSGELKGELSDAVYLEAMLRVDELKDPMKHGVISDIDVVFLDPKRSIKKQDIIYSRDGVVYGKAFFQNIRIINKENGETTARYNFVPEKGNLLRSIKKGIVPEGRLTFPEGLTPAESTKFRNRNSGRHNYSRHR